MRNIADNFECTSALGLILVGTEHVLGDRNLVARQSPFIQRTFGVPVALPIGVSFDSPFVQIRIASVEIYLETVDFAALHHAPSSARRV
jgi:hypothetical protein